MKRIFNFFTRKPTVVVRTDGGICSQLDFYAYGMELEQRGCNVYYDTFWFDTCGMDVNKEQVRMYDLERAFPEIKTRHCTQKMSKWYRRLKKRHAVLTPDVKRSMYISGYAADRHQMFVKHIDFFRQRFAPVDAHLCADVIDKMSQSQACAVHVRRGDLSQFDAAYGFPPSADYFLRAIEFVKTYNKDVTFYFFSDGMDWVQGEVIPKLPRGTKYEIIDKFGADKGYLDLYMISNADYIISSQGTLGAYAALLSKKNPVLIMSKCRYDIIRNFDNCVCINEDVKQEILHKKTTPGMIKPKI